MADEPVLCFDGDNAGLRAAYRAVDLALPRLAPGKSLNFAMLPQGQDPDDLVRSGGREAVAEVIGAARPLAAMLWARETEGHQFDTPERRAALEARINQVTARSATRPCANTTGRILPRASRSSSPRRKPRAATAARAGSAQDGLGAAAAARMAAALRRCRRAPSPARATRLMSWSASSLAAARCIAARAAAVPRREALILQAALNHPWLLHDHLEELSALEFRHPDAERLKGALIDIAAHNAGHAAVA